jgi:pimeloyl-ACP methyl ester carboxylesterase
VFAHKAVGQVADHYAEIVEQLDKKPAVIGHSLGGLLVQMIAGRGLAAATVAIDPGPFRGVLPLPLSALKSAAPVIGNPANHSRAVPLTFDQFRYGFANAVSEEEAKELYDTFAVPASGVPLFQAATRRLEPLDRGEGRHEEPRPWAAADHLQREGQHRPVGDRERVVQASAAQSRRHQDRRDAQPRPRARHRQRLA